MKVKPTDSPIDKIIMKTKDRSSVKEELVEWWTEFDEMKVAAGLCSTAAYPKTPQTWRERQIATSIRLYAGLPVYSYAGSNTSKMDETKTLPQDRPSFNLVQSATDTLVARHGQNRPMPKFLTDAGDYKQRHLAEKLNHFIGGEFYQTKTYQKATQCLKDALVTGTGCLKVYENSDHKVAIDRVGVADLYVDLNDAINGENGDEDDMDGEGVVILGAAFDDGDAGAIHRRDCLSPDAVNQSSRRAGNTYSRIKLMWALESVCGEKCR